EIVSGTIRESTRVPPRSLDTLDVLLPPTIGVDAQAELSVTLRRAEKRVEKTITVPPMRHWTVYVYPHSHVDIGYSNTQQNVEFIHKRNIDQGIALAESTRAFPDGSKYLWNTEVMWPFERYLASQPAARTRLADAVKRGELCLDAAYVNIMTTSCSDEEMVQVLRAGREASRLTGNPIDTYVQVDIPGMAWGLVEVMAHEGIRYVMNMPNGGRGNDEMVSRFRYRPFWWVGEDGTSRVLFLNAGGYGAGMDKGGASGRPWFGERDRERIPKEIRTGRPRENFLDRTLWRELPAREAEKYPYDIFPVAWAMWDNALIDAELADAVRSWNAQYAWPHVIIASAHTIMSTFEKLYGDRLPVVRGDFSEYWTDGLGTVARETRLFMNARERLAQSETVWSMLRPGKPAPRAEFDEAWRYLLLCNEHTFATENSFEPYFADAIWRSKQHYFHEADYRSRALMDDALAPASDKSNGALGPVEGPSGGGVAVINTNSWAHDGVITLSPAESRPGDRVIDPRGGAIPSQRLSGGDLVFVAPDVPPLASSHFRVTAGTPAAAGECVFTDTSLDNGVIHLVINRNSGNITHLVESGREFVKAGSGLNAFLLQPARGEGEARPDTVISVTLSEAGPLAGEIRVVSHAPGCRLLTRSIRLVAGQKCVDITNVVDKLPLLPKDGIHFAFPFNVEGGITRIDIPWGVVRADADQWPAANHAWITAEHYVDVSNATSGVTLCSLDAPLYESGAITANNTAGWDGKGDIWPRETAAGSTLYSWVMNNHWFTNTPLTQDGPVEFRYRLHPHGPFDLQESYRFGLEQAQPLIAMAASANPVRVPLITVGGNRVAVTILKSAADGKSMIVRIRSLSEKRETAELAWPARVPRSVRVCTQGETPGTVDASRSVTVPAMGYVTIRAEW
ncbi:MAG TPA: glycosyl hydrolase, partial [Bacteroidota bacterium]|nr:glycosyl hydrolase [Bacteroidota bacterium]